MIKPRSQERNLKYWNLVDAKTFWGKKTTKKIKIVNVILPLAIEVFSRHFWGSF